MDQLPNLVAAKAIINHSNMGRRNHTDNRMVKVVKAAIQVVRVDTAQALGNMIIIATLNRIRQAKEVMGVEVIHMVKRDMVHKAVELQMVTDSLVIIVVQVIKVNPEALTEEDTRLQEDMVSHHF